MKIINCVNSLKRLVENELVKNIVLKRRVLNSVTAYNIPENWILIGTGNYAAVFYHINFPDYAIKIYREKKSKFKNKESGVREEILVYKKLNSLNKNYFAKMYDYGKNYLIIDRIKGITLYDCLKKGIYIYPDNIKSVDTAIYHLTKLNLSSHDIHFKNIIITEKKVVIIDVSDFLNFEYCPLWDDSKKFYKFYKKIPLIPIPEIILNTCKIFYRIFYANKNYIL